MASKTDADSTDVIDVAIDTAKTPGYDGVVVDKRLLM
jgi:hypothetical protein